MNIRGKKTNSFVMKDHDNILKYDPASKSHGPITVHHVIGIKKHSFFNIYVHRSTDKRPKILINIRAFNHYYEQNVKDSIFGGRLNKIKQDFEKLLSSLKNAGADLIFVSKSSEDLDQESSDKDYSQGMMFISKIRKLKSVNQVNF
jgi:hypothetical protein